jgi:hypothetical protein
LYPPLNVISRLLLSKSAGPKVIIISGFHCTCFHVQYSPDGGEPWCAAFRHFVISHFILIKLFRLFMTGFGESGWDQLTGKSLLPSPPLCRSLSAQSSCLSSGEADSFGVVWNETLCHWKLIQFQLPKRVCVLLNITLYTYYWHCINYWGFLLCRSIPMFLIVSSAPVNREHRGCSFYVAGLTVESDSVSRSVWWCSLHINEFGKTWKKLPNHSVVYYSIPVRVGDVSTESQTQYIPIDQNAKYFTRYLIVQSVSEVMRSQFWTWISEKQ